LRAQIHSLRGQLDVLVNIQRLPPNNPKCQVTSRELAKVEAYREKLKTLTSISREDDLIGPADPDPFAQPNNATPRMFFVDLSLKDRSAIWQNLFINDGLLLTYQLFNDFRTTVNLYKTINQPGGLGKRFFGRLICTLLEKNWKHVVRQQMSNTDWQQPGIPAEIRMNYFLHSNHKAVYVAWRKLNAKCFSSPEWSGIDLLQVPAGGRRAGVGSAGEGDEEEDDEDGFDEMAAGMADLN